MKQLPLGETRVFRKMVGPDDLAQFESGTVHQVYSTFALARDAEWSGRLLVLDLKEAGEEGIGTGLSIEHKSPALEGQEVLFESTLTALSGNEVLTDFSARVGDRLIARGQQKQKVIHRDKLNALFAALR
jgi:predicted thioesterase